MGYHKRVIAKGTFGEASKIREELEEYEDAMEQHCDRRTGRLVRGFGRVG
jgi:hypothetical protein